MSPLSNNAKKLKEIVKELSREAIHKEIILPVMDKEEGVVESSTGIDRGITQQQCYCLHPIVTRIIFK